MPQSQEPGPHWESRGVILWGICTKYERDSISGNHRSLGICHCLQKAFARHEHGSRCWRLERERDSWGAARCRCWQEESCGWPAPGDLCGAAHRPCASALLTHSGAGEDLPAGHWKIAGKCFLIRQGMSAPSCVFASLSPGCNRWVGRRLKASEGGRSHLRK